jgi:hypothetical protein
MRNTEAIDRAIDNGPVDSQSIDELDLAIVNLAARINIASHDLLILIRRFDERAGWLKWGFENCADWLHWRCDLSLSACREKVRVAHALKTLPATGRAFAEGRLSYSKVRALTRVAHRGNEDELVGFADRWFFQRPDGRAVPSCGYRPEDLLDDDVHPSAEGWRNPSAEGWAMSLHKPPLEAVAAESG